MPISIPTVFIFCALPCEAKLLIRNWKLNQRTSGPFSIYEHPDSSQAVIVTGLGKNAMAGALGYTMALFGNPQLPILLNFGIAGHPYHPVGSAVLADKIMDEETQKVFYPSLPFSPSCASSMLTTRTRPETTYTKESLFDMEGSAFYDIASKFSSSELIHCLKVISDNCQTPISHINEMTTTEYCGNHIPTLERLIDKLQRLKNSLPSVLLDEFAAITANFHFSATNSAKLKKLLLRWQVLHQEPLAWQNADCCNSKALLSWIENQLEEDFHL